MDGESLWTTTSKPLDDQYEVEAALLHLWRNRVSSLLLLFSLIFCVVAGWLLSVRHAVEQHNKDFIARYSQILELTPTGLLIADADGEIRASNTKAETIIGKGCLVGSYIHDLCSDHKREAADAAFEEAVEGVRSSRKMSLTELECTVPGGPAVLLQVRIVPSGNDDPVVLASVIPLSSVTKTDLK